VFARESIRTSGDTVWSCHVILTHENNAVSYVSGTWGKPQTTFRTTFEIAGTNGLLRHDSRDHQPFVVDGAQADQGKGLLPATPFGESPYLTQIREVYTAFRGGPPPRVTAMDGYEAVRIAESASESLRTGQAVALSPAVAGS
jgi:myo-inositol 2-dehydrogenase/D-chiro-inositol 1-dehydrogenase